MALETRLRITGGLGGVGSGASSSSAGLAGTGNLYVVTSASPLLPSSRILTAGSSITVRTDTTAIYIDANTGGGGGGSGISVQLPAAPGAINIGSTSYVSIISHNIGSAKIVDLYTVPTGKRSWFAGATVFNNNNSISPSTATSFVKISGTYYQLLVFSNIGANSPLGLNQMAYIGEAGEIFSVQTSSANQHIYSKIVEFGTNVFWRTYKVTSIVSGNNTVFTSSNSTVACPLGVNLTFGGDGLPFHYFNGQSAGVFIQWFLTKSGALVSSSNAITGTSLIATLAKYTNNSQWTATSGDFISIYVSSAATPQMAWINVTEV